jgi:hypothetical protein
MRFTAGWMLLGCMAACSHPPAPAATPTPRPTPRASRPAVGGDGVVTFRATVSRGVLDVDDTGTLTLDDGRGARVLDRDVIAEVSVSRDGSTIAYPRRTELGTALVLRALDAQEGRVLTAGLSVADRPALSPDGALLAFWGSGGQDTVVGLYVLALRDGASPVRLNNRGVRAGGEGFVEPPIERSFVFDGPRAVRWMAADGAHREELSP